MLVPDRYDDLCVYVQEQSGARSAIVIIIDGTRGSGLSCQGAQTDLALLPAILEYAAATIRNGPRQTSKDEE